LYDMNVYNNNYKLHKWQDKGGHYLYMDNLLSSPDICDNLYTGTGKIQCCGPVKHIGMPQDIRRKKLKLRRGDI
jgi:hypothetical protein